MESLTIEIINPKAKKLLQDLADLNLIAIPEQKTIKAEEEWNNLSEQQRQAILDALDTINTGEVTHHNDVISKFRKKLLND